MEQLKVTVFHRNKGLLFGILTYCICAVIAIFLPYLFIHPSNFVFFLSAVIFIVFPLITFPYISKRCVEHASVTFDESGFNLQEIQADFSLVINWEDVASYRMQSFKIMIGKGIRLKIIYSEEKSTILYLLGIDMLSATFDDQLFIKTFFQSINKYNLQVSADRFITLLPGFFVTKWGKYISALPILLIVFDLFYRVSHPMEMRKQLLFFFFAAIMTLGFWGQVSKERKSYERLCKLQQDL